MKLFSNRSNGFTIRVLVQKLFGSLPFTEMPLACRTTAY